MPRSPVVQGGTWVARLRAWLLMPRVLFAIGEASNGLTMILFALLARLLGVDLYGSFIALAAISGILSEFVQLGFPSLITRVVAQDRRFAWAELRRALRLQAVASIPVLGLLLVYMQVAHFEGDMILPGLLIGLSMCLKSAKMTLRGVCRGLMDFRLETLFLWTERGFLLAICVAALLVSRDLMTLAVTFFVVRLIDFAAFLWVISRSVRGDDTSRLVSTTSLGSMVSFAVSGVMTSMYYQVDTAMLPILATTFDAGIYGALYRVIDFILVLPRLVLVVGFPVLVVLWKSDPVRFQASVVELGRTLTFIGLPVLLTLTWFSKPALTAAFGLEYAVGAGALATLLAGLFLAFHSMLFSQVLKASELESTLARILIITVAANVALNALLIPGRGFIGAAIAMLVTEILYFVQLQVSIRRSVPALGRLVGATEVIAVLVVSAVAWSVATGTMRWIIIPASLAGIGIMIVARPARLNPSKGHKVS